MNINATDGTWATDITLWVSGNTDTYHADVMITLADDSVTSRLTFDPASSAGDASPLGALSLISR